MGAIIDNKGASQVWPGSITQESLAPNVAGNGPAFSAYQSVAQTPIAGIYTKLLFQVEEFDTNNNFDPVLSRFTPTVPGYYHISGAAQHGVANVETSVAIYKNGSTYKMGSGSLYGSSATVSTTIYLNGTTDYVELNFYVAAAHATIANAAATYFSGFLARVA